MNKLKFIFPLSFKNSSPKKFFISLFIYLAVYIIGGFIPIGIIRNIISVYVFIGAALLMINYLTKNKDDNNETDKSDKK